MLWDMRLFVLVEILLQSRSALPAVLVCLFKSCEPNQHFREPSLGRGRVSPIFWLIPKRLAVPT